MTARPPAVVDWVPGALLEKPADELVPRLLDAFLHAVEAQRTNLAADIDSVWDGFFIDSCPDWAVPFIARLVGLPADAERAEVARVVALRRRKGTRAALEEFAEALTGWTARVVEGWQVTIAAQRPDHPRLRPAAIDLREAGRYRVGTPFEEARRSYTPGRQWSPNAATAVLWPWRVRTYADTEAKPLPAVGAGCYALHPLGAEAPLYLGPRSRLQIADFGSPAVGELTGDERDAPVRATYKLIEALAGPGDITYGARWALGPNHSLVDISEPGRPALALLTVQPNGGAEATVNWTDIRLGKVPGSAAPAAGEVVLDVCRGRVQFGSVPAADTRIRATWHRPIAGAIGALAGSAVADATAEIVFNVDPTKPEVGNQVPSLDRAIFKVQQHPLFLAGELTNVELRLNTSDRVEAPSAAVALTQGPKRWRIVAPRALTPTVFGTLDLNIADGCVTLEGFQLDGDLKIGDKMRGVELRNLTIDPSYKIAVDPNAWTLDLRIERSIVGRIEADLSARAITIVDSIVDGRNERAHPCGPAAPSTLASAVQRAVQFGPHVQAEGVTFVGPVIVEVIDATDSIFVDGLSVVQQQEGCLRHSYLGPQLSVPPSYPMQYRCLSTPPPTFTSTSFEAAGYYALALEPEHPLLSAGSDGGEVGAYHHTRRASRLARLRSRVHEFIPLGVRPGVALASWEE